MPQVPSRLEVRHRKRSGTARLIRSVVIRRTEAEGVKEKQEVIRRGIDKHDLVFRSCTELSIA